MRQTVFLCDLHEESTAATNALSVLVEGVPHRLDVCADHAAWLGALPRFAADAGHSEDSGHAERAAAHPTRRPEAPRLAPSGPATGTHTRAGSRRSLRAERAAARDWARMQGADVADRGRLPTGLLERYREQAG